MKGLVEYQLADGDSVLVEVDIDAVDGIVRAARPGEIIERAADTFEQALEKLKPAVMAVVGKLRELSLPGEITVEFGVKLGAKAGVILTSADAEANFKVSVSWKESS